MNCEICNSMSLEKIQYSGPQNPLNFKEIYVCQKCSFGKVDSPISQNELDEFYQNGHYWHDIKNTPEVLKHSEFQAKYRLLKAFSHYTQNFSPKVLDVGAGQGYIGKKLIKIAPQSVYFFLESDPSVHAKITEHNPRARPLSKSESGFDIIFLNHVVEHVIDPKSFLENFKNLLAPGGLIYIEVPNLDFNYKDDVFPHTLFFHQRSLKLLGEKLGMTILEVDTFGTLPKNSLGSKIAQKLFSFFSKLNWDLFSDKIASQIFGYQKKQTPENGIWNYLILKNNH
ncbi:MAG: methyltransferase domain-containing protein [Halobacteriovoraceae bacterium]|nr:methyltransferase domain-containing protein [Halobacteriovoraceae bacterium]